MKILVTGCAGYIGSWVVARLLANRHQVVGIDFLMHGATGLAPFIDHENFTFYKANIMLLRQEIISECDAVVNLAALVGEPLCKEQPRAAEAINHQAVNEIAAMCENTDKPLIAMSTCSNYGISSEFANEGDHLNPVSLYAKTKVQMETDLLNGFTDLKAIILRCATAYGLSFRNRFDLIVQQFIFEALSNGKITLFGSGYYRPLVHADDIARAIVMLLESGIQGKDVLNVGSTAQNYTKKQIAMMVQKRVNCEIIESTDMPDHRNYRVSFEKIRRRGFLPVHTVEKSIDNIATAIEHGAIDRPAIEKAVNICSQ